MDDLGQARISKGTRTMGIIATSDCDDGHRQLVLIKFGFKHFGSIIPRKFL